MDTLDDINPNDSRYLTSLKQREGKRLIFNIVIGLTGVTGLILFAPKLYVWDIVLIVAYGVVANIFYSFGFLLEMMDGYYLDHRLNTEKLRPILLFSGTLFACGVTLAGCYFTYFPDALPPFP